LLTASAGSALTATEKNLRCNSGVGTAICLASGAKHHGDRQLGGGCGYGNAAIEQ
jgi:acetoin utilization deacetylase AcuC-like enzyme